MTYREAVDYIEEIPKFTKKHTLEHTKEFLRRLGNPQEGQRIIHVAGTNGKGSVCAYLYAMLQAEGMRTGFFTSPHLVKINERIQVNGIPVDDETFLEVFSQVKETVEQMGTEGIEHPSYFEFLFGMGMAAFARMNLDYIILETGLGGRLDATNAIEKPELTIITSISLDHTQYLGETIREIAGEKAGIIKKGCFLIFDSSNEEASEVIREAAKACGSPCREITKDAFKIREITDKHLAFSRVNAYDDNIVWELANSGSYQMMNASLAIAGMEICMGHRVTEEQYERWKEALKSVSWEGRMEEVLPGVYLDGAHNPGAVCAFCDSLELLRQEGKNGQEGQPVILFSAVADKDYRRMIRTLCSRIPAKAYIVTEVDDGRRLSAQELKMVFEQYADCPVIAREDPAEAWAEAMRRKEPDGKMYCLGSLYLAGMVKDRLLK